MDFDTGQVVCFDPPDVAKAKWLCWYAGQFPTTEILTRRRIFRETATVAVAACVCAGCGRIQRDESLEAMIGKAGRTCGPPPALRPLARRCASHDAPCRLTPSRGGT